MSIKGFKIKDKVEKYDYESLENKPFYSEITYEINRDIISPQEVKGTGSDGMPEGYLAFPIVDNDLTSALVNVVDKGQYNLTIDETTEQITVVFNSDMNQLVFGNLSIIGLGDDTGEPYIGVVGIDYDDVKEEFSSSLVLLLSTTEPTHTIGLSHIGDTAPVIVEDTYSFEITDGFTAHFFEGLWEPSFGEDTVYNLTFDGEVYKGLSWRYREDSGMNYLGNHSILGIGDDTGENYFLFREELDGDSVVLIMVTSYEAGDYTVSLERSLVKTIETVHKIDSKYLDVKVKVPYTEDSDGNAIFKKDVQTYNGISLDSVGSNLNTLTSHVNTINSNVNTINSNVNTINSNVTTANTEITGIKTRLNVVETTQVDYNQNDSTARDYIKNRPRIRQDYIVLTDIENNSDYSIQMKSGNLVTIELPKELKITSLPHKTAYYQGDMELDLTGLVISAIYKDREEIIENYSYSEIELPFNTIGTTEIIITKEFGGVLFKTSFAVVINEFDPSVVLVDFDYTVNNRAYTLTGWKETLNGKSSTELIIPNNSLIRI